MASSLLGSLFRHKAVIGEEFLAAVDKIDAIAHAAERQAAIRLMNHIHVVDRIFAGHLHCEPHGFDATNTANTPSLGELRNAVLVSDRWYVEHVDGLTPAVLAERIAFTFTDGLHGSMSREEMLAHVISHGSYHRGAVGGILLKLSVAAPRDLFTAYLHRIEPERRAAV